MLSSFSGWGLPPLTLPWIIPNKKMPLIGVRTHLSNIKAQCDIQIWNWYNEEITFWEIRFWLTLAELRFAQTGDVLISLLANQYFLVVQLCSWAGPRDGPVYDNSLTGDIQHIWSACDQQKTWSDIDDRGIQPVEGPLTPLALPPSSKNLVQFLSDQPGPRLDQLLDQWESRMVNVSANQKADVADCQKNKSSAHNREPSFKMAMGGRLKAGVIGP